MSKTLTNEQIDSLLKDINLSKEIKQKRGAIRRWFEDVIFTQTFESGKTMNSSEIFCWKCKKGMDDGVTLFRQNEKSIAAIWACTYCNTKPIPEEVQQIVDALA